MKTCCSYCKGDVVAPQHRLHVKSKLDSKFSRIFSLSNYRNCLSTSHVVSALFSENKQELSKKISLLNDESPLYEIKGTNCEYTVVEAREDVLLWVCPQFMIL